MPESPGTPPFPHGPTPHSWQSPRRLGHPRHCGPSSPPDGCGPAASSRRHTRGPAWGGVTSGRLGLATDSHRAGVRAHYLSLPSPALQPRGCGRASSQRLPRTSAIISALDRPAAARWMARRSAGGSWRGAWTFPAAGRRSYGVSDGGMSRAATFPCLVTSIVSPARTARSTSAVWRRSSR